MPSGKKPRLKPKLRTTYSARGTPPFRVYQSTVSVRPWTLVGKHERQGPAIHEAKGCVRRGAITVCVLDKGGNTVWRAHPLALQTRGHSRK